MIALKISETIENPTWRLKIVHSINIQQRKTYKNKININEEDT